MEKILRKYNIVSFIPLRGGSKTIPLKNIKEIAGKPLAFWSIEAALNCSLINKVVVSTDSNLIKGTIKRIKSPKLEIIGRSKKTATDNASTESAMLEFAEKRDFNHIILIQATSPLLKTSDLEKGIKKYFDNKYESLFSAVRQKVFIWKEKKSGAEPINYNPLKRPLKQEWKGFFVENGAFYITSQDRLLKTKCRISGRIGIYEMPAESYFDLDEPSDWVIIERFLELKNKNAKKET